MKVSRLTRLRLLKRTRSKYETNIYNNSIYVDCNYKGFYYNWFIYVCDRCRHTGKTHERIQDI